MIQHAAVTLMDHPRVVCSPRNSRGQVNLSVADFASFRPRDLSPLRKMPARQGSGALVGRWWFASTGEHVAFGSLVERDILMVLDFMGEIEEIVERPMMVLPTRTARSSLPSPFLFVRGRDGARRLLIRKDDDESVALATVFSATSLTVSTVTAPPAEVHVARLWSGYRYSRCRLPARVEVELLAGWARPRSLREVVADASARIGDAARARAGVYSMMWRRTLILVDAAAPLSERSWVVAA